MSSQAWGLRKFADISLGAKMYSMVGALLAFLVISSLLALSNLSSSADLGEHLYTNATVPIERINGAETELGNTEADLVSAVAATSGAAQYAQAFQKDAAEVDQHLKLYATSDLSAAEKHLLATFQSDWAQYKSLGTTITKLAATGTPADRQRATAL